MGRSVFIGRVDKESESNKNNIFDDVLAFECWREKALPGHRWNKEEWHHGGGHMNYKKPEGDFFATRNQKEEADEHFKEGKPNNKIIKRPERHCGVEQTGDQRIGGTEVKQLEGTEPEVDDKKCESSDK